jgi:hypothetical protein
MTSLDTGHHTHSMASNIENDDVCTQIGSFVFCR